MTEITVTGRAERSLLADRAVLTARATYTAPQRDGVMRDATATHERLVARAAAIVADGAAERYVAHPISTSSNSWRDEARDLVTEHHASVQVEVVLVDLGIAGELSFELADAGIDVSISWELSPEVRSSQLAELRAEAVADARRAAQDFAASIGASSVELRTLREEAGFGDALPVMRMKMADMSVPEVTVREVSVSAQVTATFVAA